MRIVIDHIINFDGRKIGEMVIHTDYPASDEMRQAGGLPDGATLLDFAVWLSSNPDAKEKAGYNHPHHVADDQHNKTCWDRLVAGCNVAPPDTKEHKAQLK